MKKFESYSAAHPPAGFRICDCGLQMPAIAGAKLPPQSTLR